VINQIKIYIYYNVVAIEENGNLVIDSVDTNYFELKIVLNL